MKQRIDQHMLSKNTLNNTTFYYLTLLLIIGVVFYLLNYYSPLSSDDWHYGFICGTEIRIHSLHDIFNSQYYHYYEMNGRFIPHFWIQLFDGIIGKSTFNFVNTLVFLFFLHFTTITANSANKRNNYFILSITIAILIFLLPEFRLAMLWMSGACNYLWSSLFLLIFHYLITHEYKNQLAYPFLFIYGIISGWTHEGLVIGLGVAFFIYFLIHKQQIKQSRIILLAGFYLGAVFLITSPGSISRLNGHEISTFAVTLKAYILAFIAMDSLRISYLFLFLLLFSKITKKITFKEFFSDNIIFFTALIISFIFIIFTKTLSA